jgi:two-component system chemotaxis sensor kinase CheA
LNKEELAARLRATFVTELEEQVRDMNVKLLALEADPMRPEPLRSLFRSAHTLKGAARAAGVQMVEDVCHSLESLLAKARDGSIRLTEVEFKILFAAVDAIGDAGERLRAGDSLEGSPIEGLRVASGAETGASLQGPPPTGRAERAADRPKPEAAPTAERLPGPANAPAGPSAPGAPAPAEPVAELRVQSEKLDSLIATASQLRAASGRLARRPAELQELNGAVGRLSDGWRHSLHPLRQALSRSDAPTVLVRRIEAMAEELREIMTRSARLSGAARQDLRTVSRIADHLGHQVTSLRMRPFSEACEPVPRLVRDLAASARREVRLEIEGAEVQADREVWKAVREAILHLVRNAVDHGIEPSDVRLRSGKPPVGTIRLAADVRGDRLVVTVSDDGAGLDLTAIRAQMERSGTPAPADDREVLRLLFRGGISTRGEATMISGRGVGLDTVRETIERARGMVTADWIAGAGTVFTMDCPLSLTGTRAILARAGAQTVALPTGYVERIARVRPEEIRRVEGHDVVITPEGPVRLASLGWLLGPPLADRPGPGPVHAVLLSAAGRRLAVAVDEVVTEQELLVRPLRRVRNPPAYLSGAAILPGGEVALVLNPLVLLEAGLGARHHPRISPTDETGGESAGPAILVVDDSITTRTLEQSILEAAGYQVFTAVDGADAWRLLQEQECDLVVSDVEMPRMDGFALCEAVRASRRLRSLPIVLVTALESAEQRARGLEVGADAYLPKSSFDQEQLLQTIRQLIG